MSPVSWSEPLLAFAWQVVVHSSVMGLVFYIWAHRIGLPSGRPKRRLLTLLLVLPLFTAAVPGRGAPEFHERVAWLDSGRLLAIPVGAGLHLSNLAIVAGVLVAALTLWQELWPSFRRLRRWHTPSVPVPDRLAAIVRERAGWPHCRIVMTPSDAVTLATGGLPGRPRLLVSQGTLDALSDDELAAAVRHEHAHWRSGRWLHSHALFVVRMLQCHNPVALWCFREYCVEVEIACDADAVAGGDTHALVRPLMRIYESVDRRDAAARGALRKRVNVLLEGGPSDDALPAATIVAAGILMLLVLPWLV